MCIFVITPHINFLTNLLLEHQVCLCRVFWRVFDISLSQLDLVSFQNGSHEKLSDGLASFESYERKLASHTDHLVTQQNFVVESIFMLALKLHTLLRRQLLSAH